MKPPIESTFRARQAPKPRTKRGPTNSPRWLARPRAEAPPPAVVAPLVVAPRPHANEPERSPAPLPLPAADPPAFDGADVGFFEAGLAAEVAAADEPTDAGETGRRLGEGARRGRLLRVVAAACIACTLVCAVAFARESGGERAKELAPWATGAPIATEPPAPVTPVAPFAVAWPHAEPVVATAPAPAPGTAAPSAELAPAVPAPASAPLPPPAAPPVASAIELREKAREALERGRLPLAIALASAATELDPSDAGAWLILGAAQQTAGQASAARATFTRCTKSAKHGALSECFAMLL